METFSPLTLPSLLDNDFYKFTMQNGVINLFPKAQVRYKLINRGKHKFPEGFAAAIQQSVDNLAQVQLTQEEKRYLSLTCPYLAPTYLDFLQGYRYDPSEVSIQQQGGDLNISVSGYWYRTILWETPLMASISELYHQKQQSERISDEEIAALTKKKINKYRDLVIKIAEFGTRRRHSYYVHNLVVQTLKQYGDDCFIGTSNVHMAMLHQVKTLGTHGHEWFMFHGAKYGFKMANSLSLEHWSDVYGGDLGIALADTYTSHVFFKQFDKKFAKLFDGVRHDSGPPIEFAKKTVQHYQKNGIDPLFKTIVFSDTLNYEKVAEIAAYCYGKIGMSFGIGTNFTNDVGLTPLNIVIKMTEAFPEGGSWTPVVKISDVPEKNSGDSKMIALAKSVLGIS